MRSGLVFNVSHRISNRFLLCRMLSASARKLHRDGVSTSQCISSSLLALKDAQREPMENVAREEGSQIEQATVEELAGT
jgi:hypothetical protein